MLNCCIERKKARESSQASGDINASVDLNSSIKEIIDRSLSFSSSDDEFYECMDSDNSTRSEENAAVDDASEKTASKILNADGNENRQETPNADANDSPRDSKVKRRKNEAKSTDTKSVDAAKKRGSLLDASGFVDSLTHQAIGRLEPCGQLKLLNREPAEQMYVPVTQQPALLTEDMLEQQAVVLEK